VISIAPVSEENQGAVGMGARGRDRPTESNRSLNDVYKNKEFEIAECEEVRSSISLAQRHERHENQMKVVPRN